ncbi:MAG: hypothetical protein IT306_23590 [Chloroflexi bacterium]|nr:hypothetical protein [Chloroflexota bacterium]
MRFARLARTFAASALLVAPLVLTPAGAHAAPEPGDKEGTHERHGCPAGAVCVYPNASWNGDRPSLVFWSYGAHNLSNQIGEKRVFNNQVDGAVARTCTGFDGKGCQGFLHTPRFIDVDLTPINSIVLDRAQ